MVLLNQRKHIIFEHLNFQRIEQAIVNFGRSMVKMFLTDINLLKIIVRTVH
ncbi:hypothetical protein WUBG_16882 [Wuchereria bancrofti]|uniref:Uncharacterized protein n=1 Tax=Wuchereria bancrofti TaxID=6293 RepID=J9ADY4_WUCBA|nr:hypothetical protein WUBG_16882 [Wuchereria bancrofti]